MFIMKSPIAHWNQIFFQRNCSVVLEDVSHYCSGDVQTAPLTAKQGGSDQTNNKKNQL